MSQAQMRMHPTMLFGQRESSSLTADKCLSELIDNALDAASRERRTLINVAIDRKADSVVIEDNGVGCPDMARFADLGLSVSPLGGARLGRYGSGGTLAMVAIGNRVSVSSTHGGIKRQIRLDIEAMREAGECTYDILPECAAAPDESGTRIEITGLIKTNRWTDWNISEIANRLARRYMKALERGKSIFINGLPLRPEPMPDMVRSVAFDGECQGRRYSCTFGILTDAAFGQWKKSNGWMIELHGRFLYDKPRREGFGDYSEARCVGFVELMEGSGGDWCVSLTKDNLDDAQFDALIDHITAREDVQALLIEGNKAADEVFFASHDKKLNSALARMFGRRIKEKREPSGEDEGTVEPTNSGRERTNASKTDPTERGSVISAIGARSVKLVWQDLDHQDQLAEAKVDHKSRTATVVLNESHPVLNSMRRTQYSFDTIAPIICGHLAILMFDDRKGTGFLWQPLQDDMFQTELHEERRVKISKIAGLLLTRYWHFYHAETEDDA